jgi:hypothetical protein
VPTDEGAEAVLPGRVAERVAEFAAQSELLCRLPPGECRAAQRSLGRFRTAEPRSELL